jgi:hypothetical protein
MEIDKIASMLSDDIRCNNGRLIKENYTSEQYDTIVTALSYLNDNLIEQANASDDEEITKKLEIIKSLSYKIASFFMPKELSQEERKMVLDALLLIKKHYPTMVSSEGLDEAFRMFSN